VIAFFSSLAAVWPVISKLLDLATTTDTEKLAHVNKALLEYMEDISIGLKKAKETKGDTSELEKILNRRR
jgi:hypothetical protein